MARQGWGRHTVVATGSNDASKQVSVNAWNNDLDETGMLGFDLETKTLSSDALTPVSTANIVAGEGASADDFSFITYGSSPDIAEEDILFFYKGSQVITVTHNTSSAPSNSGNIQLIGAASKVLDTNLPLILQRKGNVFYEIVSSADSVTASSTTTFTNKSIDLTDNTLTGSSAELATAISDETGSGSLVFATSPTFVTPVLGTPSGGTLTSCTGLPITGLASGTSANLAGRISDETGTGVLVFATSPSLVTPVLGTPASGTLTNCTFPTLNQSTTGSSASCTGLSATATALATGRTISTTGDVVWTSSSFDGSGTVTGVAAIGTGVIVNADVKSDAAIDYSKLAALTSAYLLVGNGSAVATGVALSGDATLANDGALTLDSDVRAIGVQDMAVPASACWGTSTAGADGLTAVEAAADQPTYQVWEFDSGTEQHIQFCVPMPRNYNNGTITASFYWTAASSSGDVVWAISGRAFSNDDAIGQAFGTEQTVTDTLTATNDVCVSSATGAITLAGSPADSDMWQIQLTRNAADGSDTLSADARLFSVVIHYTTDSAVAG